MAFVDEVRIHLKAGNGGDGVVRWLHLKGKEFSGPAGGDGGRGGDVYAEAVRDINALKNYVNKESMSAEDGQEGRSKSQEGKNGEDLVLKVPIGTYIKNLETGFDYDLTEKEEKVRLLKGGTGGFGNEHFKSSTNTRPKEWTSGKPGDRANFYIEVRMAVDAGLVGLPSAGKSSLLNALTGARSKTGEYDFTTLEPHLGNLYGYILADIPGLIEGASKGKGLGHKFLRHIRRTRVILHSISLQSKTPAEDYEVIRKELGDYHQELLHKPEIIILTKEDEADKKKIDDTAEVFREMGKTVFSVTILDDKSVKRLSDNLARVLEESS